jgi:hypothetical protein
LYEGCAAKLTIEPDKVPTTLKFQHDALNHCLMIPLICTRAEPVIAVTFKPNSQVGGYAHDIITWPASGSTATCMCRSVSCNRAPRAQSFASSVLACSTRVSSASTTPGVAFRASHPGGKSEICWRHSAKSRCTIESVVLSVVLPAALGPTPQRRGCSGSSKRPSI